MISSSDPAAQAAPKGMFKAVVVSYRSAATIDECLERLRACDGVGAIRVVDNQSDLVNEQGERDVAVRRRDPDFGAMLAGILRPWAAPKMAVAPIDSQPLQEVQATSGALMLMPRELFARIGGFDEGYRLHAEDLDLCRRVREAGGVVAVANGIRVVHVRGVSSRSRPFFVEWNKHRGLWRYFRKFEAPRRGALVRAGVFAAIWLRFPIAALRAALR